MQKQLFTLSAIVLASAPASAQPTVQPLQPVTYACLGNLDTFLTCPAGSQRSGTECRAREPHRGQADGEHWSGSKRQGPSVFLRDDGKTVTFAASYKDHKKTGRVFHFDSKGRLESWADLSADGYHGLAVTCTPEGRMWHLAYYKNDKLVGISRSWKASDGSFSYAMDHADGGVSLSITPTADQMKRPDQLCQPVKCDVNAKPDLSGIP